LKHTNAEQSILIKRQLTRKVIAKHQVVLKSPHMKAGAIR